MQDNDRDKNHSVPEEKLSDSAEGISLPEAGGADLPAAPEDAAHGERAAEGSLSPASAETGTENSAPADVQPVPAESGAVPAEPGAVPAESGAEPAESGAEPAESGTEPAEPGTVPAERAEAPAHPAGINRSAAAPRNFAARMGDAGYVVGRRYDAIKNAFLSYRPAGKKGRSLRARITRGGETFGCGRTVIAKLCLVGGYLRLFLALDPKAYNVQKYHHKDYSEVARYAKLPFMLRLTSDRQVRYAIELIDVLMRSHGFVPDENYIPSDQAGIFEQRGRRRARVVYIERPGGLPPAVGELVADDGEEDDADALPSDEALQEEAAAGIPVAVDVRLPVRAAVIDREGNRVGKVRKSVWYDNEDNDLGFFRKEETNVFFYGGGVRTGYVDGNNNVLTLSDGYMATLRRFRWAVLAVILVIVALATALSVILSAYLMDRSQNTDYAPVLFVAGEDGTSWAETENIPVFMNERFGDTVIAPGMSGSYEFVFENRNAHALEFAFTFGEENEYGIRLVYRLRRDGVYIAGRDGALTAEELSVSGMTIEAHSSSVFEIEWQWLHDDAADTAAGENGAQYTLQIAFSASVSA